MKTHTSFGAFTIALLGFAAVAARAEEGKAEKIKVVIVDGQNDHAWQETTPYVKKWLEASGRFSVEVATAPARPTGPEKPRNLNNPTVKARYEDELAKFEPILKKYSEAMDQFAPTFEKHDVVLLNYNGDNWSQETREALETLMESGKGGLVVIHAANNSFQRWKEYNDMIGMGWRANTFGERLILDQKGEEIRVDKGKGPSAGHGRKHTFKITIRDNEHPIVQGMP